MVTVHYRGDGPALSDLIGGQIEVYFSSLPAAIELIKAGKLRALAVTGDMRSDALLDVPTVAEFVSSYEASAFFGIGAPKNTPVEIIGRLNDAIKATIVDRKIQDRLADLGGTVLVLSPAEFGKLIAEETVKWSKVVRAANIRAQ
jgi:tripartite-type tricarboxylate transporter receptor subunit TctC